MASHCRLYGLDGFNSIFAYNGSAGLNLALEGRYDIILTDINMPKMDGLGVCQSLRKQGVTTPIYSCDARHVRRQVISGVRGGFRLALSQLKPFAMERLKYGLWR
ncbi:response regulator [Vibrio lentus]|nr:response regulator [Vibrio lentus]